MPHAVEVLAVPRALHMRLTRCTLPCRAELLQLHLELRGEKALDYDLYVGDYTGASLRPGNDARVVSLHAACAGGAPRRGLASGSPRRVANVLRGLLAAAGVRLWSRCEAVDLDDTVEGTAGRVRRSDCCMHARA